MPYNQQLQKAKIGLSLFPQKLTVFYSPNFSLSHNIVKIV